MCRSIKTLRPPFVEQLTDDDVHAAALQYVRKVSGFRTPAAHNADAFNEAVETIAEATAQLLANLRVRGGVGSAPDATAAVRSATAPVRGRVAAVPTATASVRGGAQAAAD